ncbi:Uncharacterised protein [Mycobacteroides abscessus subsp. abscessus]|nr:Uncharacterised protein [Mycobacteroides abscessus subsp. abscessus]
MYPIVGAVAATGGLPSVAHDSCDTREQQILG